MPDHALPSPVDPLIASAATRAHVAKVLDGYRYEYDNDRTVLVWLHATARNGETHEYLVRLTFMYYPDWPPSVAFLNPDTREYDGTHWPASSGSPRLIFYARYGDSPAGMVCNSMTFEYYFWGGHNPTAEVRWDQSKYTFAATIAELTDHLRPPYYHGRQT